MSVADSFVKKLFPLVVVAAGSSCLISDPSAADKVPASLPAVEPTQRDVAYGSLPEQKLDLYLPANAAAPSPVIVWVHGGGWIGGDKYPAQRSILSQVQRGIAVASINYRLAPAATFPAPVQDVKLAIRFIKANAARFGLSNVVLVGGESAGGHLASFAAVTPGLFEPSAPGSPDSRVNAVIDFVGPTDLVAFYRDSVWHALAGALLGCPIVGTDADGKPIYECAEQALREASVTTYLDSSDPPAYMAYGADDPIVVASSQGQSVAEKWAVARGQALAQSGAIWYDLVEGAAHNIAPLASDFPPGTPDDARKTYNYAAMQRFLDIVAPR